MNAPSITPGGKIDETKTQKSVRVAVLTGAGDTVFSAASVGLALLLGVAFVNVVGGVPMDLDGNIWVSFFGLLTP